MAGPVPAIYAFLRQGKTWMAATSAAMTNTGPPLCLVFITQPR
jgi:hypothetical protein